MFRNIGWAAFLALYASVSGACVAAAALGSRPTYACFSPQNAAAIGRLGAADATVRFGFDSGECLALPAGARFYDVERHGELWRFRAFGARPYLYAADWAAGFRPAQDLIPPGFERFLPVTARLLASGRIYARCYDDGERLSQRIREYEERLRAYERWGRARLEGTSSPKVVIYVGDAGPRLRAEGLALQREAEMLDRRCSSVAAMEPDDDFVDFMRTARHA